MNKYFRTGLIMVLGLVLATFVYIATQKSATKPVVAGTTTVINEEVTVKIANTSFEKKIAFEPKMTALEATKIATNGEVKTSGEGTNAFVLEILDKTAEKLNREFWELMVNGQSALMGAGSLKLKAGDTIEWKISKF